jgi:hypothetical protein
MLKKLYDFLESRNVQTILLFVVILAYYFYSFGKVDIVSSEDDVHLYSAVNLSLPLQKFGNFGYYIFLWVVSKVTANSLIAMFLSYFMLSILVYVSLFLLLRKYLGSFYIAFF